MGFESWLDLYKSDAQAVYALLVVPAAFLVWLLAGAPGRGAPLEPARARFVHVYALAFAIETLLDPIATGPFLRAFELEGGAAGRAIPLGFVLLGDFRVFALILPLAAPAHALRRRLGEAALLSFAVPVVDALVLLAGPPEQILWLVHELCFTALALAFLVRVIPARVGPERAPLRRYLRRVAGYVAAYYALWAASDLLILNGVDSGWALRVVPNQLYYAFYVPFAYLSFFGARSASTSSAVHASR